MQESKPPATAEKQELTRQIADRTSTGTIIGGCIAFGIILLAVPPLLFLLPIVLIAMAVLFFLDNNSRRKALRIAKSHMRGQESKLLVDVSVGNADAIVANDWGMVYVRPGHATIQCAWHDVQSVRERHLGVLEFECRNANFEVDVSVLGYFILVEAIYGQIPDRCHFTIDPVTGESTWSNLLSSSPLEWKSRHGNFALDSNGVEFNGAKMRWSEIQSVKEVDQFVDEYEPYRALSFSGTSNFDVPAKVINLRDSTPRFTDFDLVRAILQEKIGLKCAFTTSPPSPRERALAQFKLMHESYAAALSLAMNSGKYEYINKRFASMLSLVDKYKLSDDYDVKQFFREYALLLERMGRASEAALLESRAR